MSFDNSATKRPRVTTRENQGRDKGDLIMSEEECEVEVEDVLLPAGPGSGPGCAPSPARSVPESDAESVSSTMSHSKSQFRFSEHPNLDQIRQLQSQFCEERNWDQYHTPRNLMLALVGEVGELAELFQWRGEVKAGLPDWSEKDKTHVGQELSDCLIYLVRLAEKCHVDLPAEVLNKMELNKQKYPVKQVYGSSKKYTEYNNKD